MLRKCPIWLGKQQQQQVGWGTRLDVVHLWGGCPCWQRRRTLKLWWTWPGRYAQSRLWWWLDGDEEDAEAENLPEVRRSLCSPSWGAVLGIPDSQASSPPPPSPRPSPRPGRWVPGFALCSPPPPPPPPGELSVKKRPSVWGSSLETRKN